MTSQIKIDKHVPIPEESFGGAHPKYPFATMQVGDSFFLPMEERNRVSVAAATYRKRHGVKCTVRTVTENGNRGCRVWRIE